MMGAGGLSVIVMTGSRAVRRWRREEEKKGGGGSGGGQTALIFTVKHQ